MQETNRFASQVLKGGDISASYLQKWKETNENKVYVFIAFMMLNSQNRKRQLKEQWLKNPLLPIPQFSARPWQGIGSSLYLACCTSLTMRNRCKVTAFTKYMKF
jgi:hypothetical protein